MKVRHLGVRDVEQRGGGAEREGLEAGEERHGERGTSGE